MQQQELEVLNTNEVVKQENNNGLMNAGDVDIILDQAAKAEKYVDAVNKIIKASLSITNDLDWVLIGGTPYLQETGASKVAKLFGISWKIKDQKVERDEEGYKTFTYTLEMWDKSQTIECEGSRSMRDTFFSKTKDGLKKPEEIDERNVKASAMTNAINTGIKRIIPGLRGINIETLQKAGIETSKLKGYSFKTGSQGGTDTRKAETSGIVCEECEKALTQQVASFSESKFKKKLCYECQKKESARLAEEKKKHDEEVKKLEQENEYF